MVTSQSSIRRLPSASGLGNRTLTCGRCERYARTVPQAWQRHYRKRVTP